MNSRQRIMAALNFEPVDRLPKDLGAMGSTGISAFAYVHLVNTLGLPPRRPRVYHITQNLSFVEDDVLDALGCDVVNIAWSTSSVLQQPEKWHDYDFGGRLEAKVEAPEAYSVLDDGTVVMPEFKIKMPPTSTVFDAEHGGQGIDWSAELPKADLDQRQKKLEEGLPTKAAVQEIADVCKQTRQATDRAVFFNEHMFNSGLGIASEGGLAVFPILCMTEPEYVARLHKIKTDYCLKRIEMILPHIADDIDVVMTAADDWGTQMNLIAPPSVYQDLFLPYYKQINDRVHEIAPHVKTFLHCCGAVYDLIDLIIDSGFDVLNPVQWSAGQHSYKAWKDKCRNRIALWGGGLNSQHTLAQGTLDEIQQEVKEVGTYLAQDSGFVFNIIHNFLSEADPQKIIKIYQAADTIAV